MSEPEPEPTQHSAGEASPAYVSDDADDELITAADEGLPRDEHGNLEPQIVHVDRLGGKVKTLPIIPDDFEEHVAPFVSGDADVLDDDTIAHLLDKNLVVPDLTNKPTCPDDRVTGEWVANNLPQERQVGYLIAMLRAGRYHQTADRLEGDIPEGEKELLVEVIKDEDRSLDDVEGN